MQTLNISALKKNLRTEIMERRKKLTEDYCQAADEKIAHHIIALEEYQSSKTLFCFVSTEDEVNTYPIIRHALSVGKRVCVPKCISKGFMQAFEISGTDCLEKGSYGIMEPNENCPMIISADIDFCIVPCMSCNTKGQRLGYGGGYYDRFLSNTVFPSAVVCREKLTCEDIPTLDQDVRISIVITEAGIWRIK
ncbi:5-formyltetrahydrofolate cyclo-ligase [Clostridium aminobutyricum]|uniref:5-formyltetrahydrofolate cyclo-ligase n=1 Tax=Clostridium aminobutyricum TaxID=33953 RepID=A0A939DBS2_CLOAM|nr:5-formyltetrahydrofolate cyclo-ligase [Clostridium aminobutyricum]MBN7774383.1 5-formyltetrahydrofolate cyclo-ligase [Clostridium aminobutyricum]